MGFRIEDLVSSESAHYILVIGRRVWKRLKELTRGYFQSWSMARRFDREDGHGSIDQGLRLPSRR